MRAAQGGVYISNFSIARMPPYLLINPKIELDESTAFCINKFPPNSILYRFLYLVSEKYDFKSLSENKAFLYTESLAVISIIDINYHHNLDIKILEEFIETNLSQKDLNLSEKFDQFLNQAVKLLWGRFEISKKNEFLKKLNDGEFEEFFIKNIDENDPKSFIQNISDENIAKFFRIINSLDRTEDNKFALLQLRVWEVLGVDKKLYLLTDGNAENRSKFLKLFQSFKEDIAIDNLIKLDDQKLHNFISNFDYNKRFYYLGFFLKELSRLNDFTRFSLANNYIDSFMTSWDVMDDDNKLFFYQKLSIAEKIIVHNIFEDLNEPLNEGFFITLEDNEFLLFFDKLTKARSEQLLNYLNKKNQPKLLGLTRYSLANQKHCQLPIFFEYLDTDYREEFWNNLNNDQKLEIYQKYHPSSSLVIYFFHFLTASELSDYFVNFSDRKKIKFLADLGEVFSEKLFNFTANFLSNEEYELFLLSMDVMKKNDSKQPIIFFWQKLDIENKVKMWDLIYSDENFPKLELLRNSDIEPLLSLWQKINNEQRKKVWDLVSNDWDRPKKNLMLSSIGDEGLINLLDCFNDKDFNESLQLLETESVYVVYALGLKCTDQDCKKYDFFCRVFQLLTYKNKQELWNYINPDNKEELFNSLSKEAQEELHNSLSKEAQEELHNSLSKEAQEELHNSLSKEAQEELHNSLFKEAKLEESRQSLDVVKEKISSFKSDADGLHEKGAQESDDECAGHKINEESKTMSPKIEVENTQKAIIDCDLVVLNQQAEEQTISAPQDHQANSENLGDAEQNLPKNNSKCLRFIKKIPKPRIKISSCFKFFNFCGTAKQSK